MRIKPKRYFMSGPACGNMNKLKIGLKCNSILTTPFPVEMYLYRAKREPIYQANMFTFPEGKGIWSI